MTATAKRRAARLAGAIAGLLALIAIYAVALEPRRLQTVRYRLGVSNLPSAFQGTVIVHLTDFHVGMRGTRRSTLQHAIKATHAARPDLIALTGDYVDEGIWERSASIIGELTAIAPTIGVLGNHDRESSASETSKVVDRLRSLGVQLLANDHVAVAVRGGAAHLVIVAVDDPVTEHANLTAALRGLPSTADPDQPALLLTHAPDIIDRAPANRFVLTLAGHTHGAQVRLSPFHRRTPLDLPMVAGGLDSAYARGAHVVNGNPLFVNHGLGVSSLPVRFLAPPQIAIFTLERGIDESCDADDPGRFLSLKATRR